jgi:hypothetical protein
MPNVSLRRTFLCGTSHWHDNAKYFTTSKNDTKAVIYEVPLETHPEELRLEHDPVFFLQHIEETWKEYV